MKIAIRQSQKINVRIHNSRIAIRQRIAQLGLLLFLLLLPYQQRFTPPPVIYHGDKSGVGQAHVKKKYLHGRSRTYNSGTCNLG